MAYSSKRYLKPGKFANLGDIASTIYDLNEALSLKNSIHRCGFSISSESNEHMTKDKDRQSTEE